MGSKLESWTGKTQVQVHTDHCMLLGDLGLVALNPDVLQRDDGGRRK